jgi:hypothetical protein
LYTALGDLKKANEFSEKAEDNRDFKKSLYYNAFLATKGRMLYEMGKIGSASKCSLNSFEALYDQKWFGGSLVALHNLILIGLEKGDIQKADLYLSQFEDIVGIKGDHFRFWYVSLKGLVLKHHSRASTKFQAHTYFDEIISMKRVDYQVKLNALIHKCDLLLDELKMYKDTAVIDELSELLKQISRVTDNQRSLSVLLELNILQSKFALLQGNLDLAKKLLDHNHEIAASNGFGRILNKIKKENDSLIMQFNEWNNLMASNSDLEAHVKQSLIENYIDDALKIQKEHDSI